MRYEYLHIKKFKSLENMSLPLDAGLTVLLGKNGVGKTNLLEALALFAPTGADWVRPPRDDFDVRLQGRLDTPLLAGTPDAEVFWNILFQLNPPGSPWPNGTEPDLLLKFSYQEIGHEWIPRSDPLLSLFGELCEDLERHELDPAAKDLLVEMYVLLFKSPLLLIRTTQLGDFSVTIGWDDPTTDDGRRMRELVGRVREILRMPTDPGDLPITKMEVDPFLLELRSRDENDDTDDSSDDAYVYEEFWEALVAPRVGRTPDRLTRMLPGTVTGRYPLPLSVLNYHLFGMGWRKAQEGKVPWRPPTSASSVKSRSPARVPFPIIHVGSCVSSQLETLQLVRVHVLRQTDSIPDLDELLGTTHDLIYHQDQYLHDERDELTLPAKYKEAASGVTDPSNWQTYWEFMRHSYWECGCVTETHGGAYPRPSTESGSGWPERSWIDFDVNELAERRRLVWHVRDSLITLLDDIEIAMREILPLFILENSQVALRMTPLARWIIGGPRTQVLVEESSLVEQGSGIRRWVTASVREAARRVLITKSGVLQPALMVIDEPEAHLHPIAQDQVAQWCLDAVTAGTSIVVATHSPAFLRIESENAGHIIVTKNSSGLTAVDTMADYLGVLGLEEMLADAGLGARNLLSAIRGFVIVEGKHDRRVLDVFFGEMLSRSRVLLLTLHGVRNAKSLLEAELLPTLGIRTGILFDGIGERAWKAKREESWMRPEERAIHELRQADPEGTRYATVPFDLPDILAALPRSAIQRAYGESATLDNWEELPETWKRLGRQGRINAGDSFKDWLLREIGVPDRPTPFLDKVLEAADPDVDQPDRRLTTAVTTLVAQLLSGHRPESGPGS